MEKFQAITWVNTNNDDYENPCLKKVGILKYSSIQEKSVEIKLRAGEHNM